MDWELPPDTEANPDRIRDALGAFQKCFLRFKRGDGAMGEMDPDDVASMASGDMGMGQEMRDGVLGAYEGAMDEQRLRQLEDAERSLQAQEEVLQKTVAKAAEAEQRNEELELDYEWLRQQWKDAHGEYPSHRPGSPRDLSTPAVKPINVPNDRTMQREVSAFELHREEREKEVSAQETHPRDAAIDRCFGPSETIVSDVEPNPSATFDKLGNRDIHADPNRASETAQMEGFLRREQELQRRWEALVSRCVQQAPLQPYTQTPPRGPDVGMGSPSYRSMSESSWQRPHVPTRQIGTPSPVLPMSGRRYDAFPPPGANTGSPNVVNFGGVWNVI